MRAYPISGTLKSFGLVYHVHIQQGICFVTLLQNNILVFHTQYWIWNHTLTVLIAAVIFAASSSDFDTWLFMLLD